MGGWEEEVAEVTTPHPPSVHGVKVFALLLLSHASETMCQFCLVEFHTVVVRPHSLDTRNLVE